MVLGSTGSVGTQALEAAAALPPGKIEIVGLAADRNAALLAEQIGRFAPRWVCVTNAAAARGFRRDAEKGGFRLFESAEGLAAIAKAAGADAVFNAVVGIAGLKPTLSALEAGRAVMMANKESLVSAGSLILKTAMKHGAALIPVDSEPSAIFQCLQGRRMEEVRRVILTASGGPFLRRKNFRGVTPAQALAHPRWKMGRKVSVDSATLMNKGLELIEAAALFGLPPERIDLVIHPESIIHSLVELADGSMMAHLAAPDMKIPITYALTYPERESVPGVKPVSLTSIGRFNFEEADEKRFPCVGLARAALRRGGLAPAALSAADEVAVDAFLAGKIEFTDIAKVIEITLEKLEGRLGGEADSIEKVLDADAAARRAAHAVVKRRRLGKYGKYGK